MKALRGVRDNREAGFTIAEMAVVMALFTMLLVMVFSILITISYQAEDSLARSRAVEQARLGIAHIDRQVRSGNLIRDPGDPAEAVASDVPIYYSVRIYTQEGGIDPRCAQWRVWFASASDEYGDLQYREWDPNNPTGTVTSWTTVASNTVEPPVSNTPDIDDPRTWPPFWISEEDDRTEAQNLRITLRLSDPTADHRANAITVSTVVTGRNTVFGYSETFCEPAPAP